MSTILPPRLCKHIFSVEACACELYPLFGEGEVPHDLRVAALLHDVTKAEPLKQHLILCEELDILLSVEDMAAPKVIHAKTGAEVARKYFGASDTVYRAIRSHTVGSPCMTLIDKLIFVADSIEPTREDEDCVALRDYFYAEYPRRKTPSGRDALLDELARRTLDSAIQYLVGAMLPVHPDTLASRNAFVRDDQRML